DCLINKEFLKLYKKFCPGPLTFILPLKKKSKISKNVTNNKKNLAVRFPKHKIMRALLKKVNYPLAAPSANLSTRVSAVNPNDVKDDFGEKIKYILNGGPSSIGVESTIIDIVKNPKILRLGGLKISEIQKTLKKRIRIENNPKKISAPGQYKLHYSPGIPIKLNVKKANNNQAFLLIKKQKDDQPNYYYLTKTRNLNEAARNLYSTLRQIKKDKFKYIVVQKIPSIGLGKTINDRLLRASKF
ncbi:MAG: translation factor Sua5, partial [Pelagibacteraceae bacterium BACL5 MAG-121128-bin54]